MKLLAVESATLSGGAALLDDDRLLGEITLNIAITHSERLLAAVDRLVADCGLVPTDLDGLAVSVGPGSFTGLRVGLATVDRKSTRLNSSHVEISYAVFCLKKKKKPGRISRLQEE